MEDLDSNDKKIQDILDEYTTKAREFVAANPDHPKVNQYALFLHPRALEVQIKTKLLFMHLYPQCINGSDLVVIEKAILIGFKLLNFINPNYELGNAHKTTLDITPDSGKEQTWTMVQISQIYERRFDMLGVCDDLEQCIILNQESMVLYSDGGVMDALREAMLCKLLLAKFQTFASTNANILNEAIDSGRRGLRVLDNMENALMRVGCLGNLAGALRIRYLYFKSEQDDDDSIMLMREALRIAIENGLSAETLATQRSNLAAALQPKLRSRDPRGELTDIAKECVELHRQSIADTQDNLPAKFIWLFNLASSLIDSHDVLGDLGSLEEGIQIIESLRVKSDLTPRQRVSLGGVLGLALFYRYRISDSVDDLSSSIQVLEETLTLKGDAPISKHEQNFIILPFLLWWRYRRLDNREDLNRLRVILDQMRSSPTLPLELYFMFICTSAYVHYYNHEPEKAVSDFKIAINIFPDVLLSGKDYHTSLLVDQNQNNSAFIQLAQHGVAACIACGRYTEAIEILESGRSIGWSKNFRLRSRFDDLAIEYPDYATKLQTFVREAIASRDAQSQPMPSQMSSATPIGESIWERTFLSSQSLMEIVKEIRTKEGYERFWLPMKYDELSVAATKGPVIVVNLCKWRSHALLITTSTLDRPQVVPLSNVIWELVQRRSEELRKGTSEMESGLLTEKDLNRRVLRPILRDLWQYIVFPVSQVLQCLAPYARRVWWCPTGPLVSLPLHMASDGDAEPPYISSYVMTITSLLHARNHIDKSRSAESVKVLAVSCPNVPGYQSLPGAAREIEVLEETLPDKNFTRLVEETATVENVLQQLSSHSWMHLSCHGFPATGSDAYRTRFVLSDGNLYMSDIIRQPYFNAQFVFLSACHTATSISVLDDEAMHLAASMSFLGFSSVIATLWAVKDDITPLLISRVYKYLFERPGKAPDAEDAAEALHNAVHGLLRENLKGKSTLALRLAPFVHMGV